jgi:hypothetical protein
MLIWYELGFGLFPFLYSKAGEATLYPVWTLETRSPSWQRSVVDVRRAVSFSVGLQKVE